MVKFVTYSENKTKALAESTIDGYIDALFNEFDRSVFSKLCGTICYSMLFNIPEFDLVNGKYYSIEMICFNVPSTLAKETHVFLDVLADCAVEKVDANAILQLLKLDELNSIILLSHAKLREFYCILVMAYSNLVNDERLYRKAVNACTVDSDYNDIRNLFK